MYSYLSCIYTHSKSGIAYTFLTDEDTEVNSRPIILLLLCILCSMFCVVYNIYTTIHM